MHKMTQQTNRRNALKKVLIGLGGLSVIPKLAIASDMQSKEERNKAIVGEWFTNFWGKTCDLNIVDKLAAPNMLLQYSLHEPRHGHQDIKAFMTDFRRAFQISTFGVLPT